MKQTAKESILCLRCITQHVASLRQFKKKPLVASCLSSLFWVNSPTEIVLN